MTKSLKEKNRPFLVIVVLTNIAVYTAILISGFNVEKWIPDLVNIQQYAPVIFVSIIVGILNAQLNPNTKARLVFWRWSYPLPGCRAFSEYIHTDSRIDKSTIQRLHNLLPTLPYEQNALWYKWYREFQNEPSVIQVHREYLFTRDYAGLSFLMIIGLWPLSIWQYSSLSTIYMYLGVLVLQYLLVRWAARNHGIRFVTTVLSIKAASI